MPPAAVKKNGLAADYGLSGRASYMGCGIYFPRNGPPGNSSKAQHQGSGHQCRPQRPAGLGSGACIASKPPSGRPDVNPHMAAAAVRQRERAAAKARAHQRAKEEDLRRYREMLQKNPKLGGGGARLCSVARKAPPAKLPTRANVTKGTRVGDKGRAAGGADKSASHRQSSAVRVSPSPAPRLTTQHDTSRRGVVQEGSRAAGEGGCGGEGGDGLGTIDVVEGIVDEVDDGSAQVYRCADEGRSCAIVAAHADQPDAAALHVSAGAPSPLPAPSQHDSGVCESTPMAIDGNDAVDDGAAMVGEVEGIADEASDGSAQAVDVELCDASGAAAEPFAAAPGLISAPREPMEDEQPITPVQNEAPADEPQDGAAKASTSFVRGEGHSLVSEGYNTVKTVRRCSAAAPHVSAANATISTWKPKTVRSVRMTQ
ncbi:unnamed protein product [Vitrella brassicaformis CCMP3155]|uniref:Uncharacterized protein n=1 Tax=Vitrella brassicaformis (strain CCMP3155) TaxID=1169540 RepID=A0A0G4EYM3_VITBC|nr:unnamed protein product [Vitrella brassicaformis CCMP3155]|eukprot:CEM04462.1 unnamed protein product [Vitrella brassicaformis CCMP3155]